MNRCIAVAALNFGTNALLLAGAGSLTGREMRLWRLLLAAALGAAHAAVCLLPRWHFLGALPWYLLLLAVMAAVTFGADVKTGCTFLLTTMALGGAVRAAGRGGLWQLPLCAAGIGLAGQLAFSPGRRIIPVEIAGRGQTLQISALYDTGNELRDPITGQSVLVIGSGAAKKLTGLSQNQLAQPLKTMEEMPLPGLRLVPYRAVGAENGLLLAMHFAAVRVGRRTRGALVAFAPQNFGTEYQALAGGNLC